MENKKEMVRVMLSQTLNTFVHKHKDNDKILEGVSNSFEGAMAYIRNMPRGHARIMKLYEDMDRAIKDGYDLAKVEGAPPTSCKRGCAHCCHLFVTTTNEEADFIYKIVKDKNIPLSRKRLSYQARFKRPSDYFTKFGKRTRCVFLNDQNDCMIYNYRPISCRKYFVVSHPDQCQPDGSGEFQTVSAFLQLSPEVLASAHLNLDFIDSGEVEGKTNHSLAARLLKRME